MQVEVVESVPGGIFRDSVSEPFSSECGDFIRKDNCVPRRFGFDDFLEFFLCGSFEGFGVGFVSVSSPFSSRHELPLFVEVPILNDVVAGVGESCVWFWSLLDVWMSSIVVKVVRVAD